MNELLLTEEENFLSQYLQRSSSILNQTHKLIQYILLAEISVHEMKIKRAFSKVAIL